VCPAGSDPEDSLTLTLEAATRIEGVLGTADMAPEQAKGEAGRQAR